VHKIGSRKGRKKIIPNPSDNLAPIEEKKDDKEAEDEVEEHKQTSPNTDKLAKGGK